MSAEAADWLTGLPRPMQTRCAALVRAVVGMSQDEKIHTRMVLDAAKPILASGVGQGTAEDFVAALDGLVLLSVVEAMGVNLDSVDFVDDDTLTAMFRSIDRAARQLAIERSTQQTGSGS